MTLETWFQALVAGLASGTVLAAIISAIGKGWFDRRIERLKYELSLDAKTHELMLRSQIEFKERQLAEFYGPIYAYLKRGRPIYDLWEKGRLREIEGDTRELFTIANDEIVRIILTKSHLVQGDEIPKSFTHFLTHVAIWHAYLKTPHKGVPFEKEEFPEAYYPDGFEREIFTTTESLKRELDDLHHKYGLQAKSASAIALPQSAHGRAEVTPT
jgi:hypothetical protein